MNELVRLISNSAFIAGQRIGNGFLQFIFFLFLINVFSPDDFGLFELGRACLEIGTGTAVPGLAMLVVRENSRQNDWWVSQGAVVNRLLQWIVLAVGTSIFLSMILESWSVTRFFVLGIFCGSVYFQSACSIYEALMVSIDRVRWSMAVNVFCSAGAVIFGILAVWFLPYPLLGACLAVILRWAVNHLLLVYRTHRHFGDETFTENSSTSAIVDLLKESWPLTIGAVSFIVYARVDTIMLEWLGSTRSIALYSGAYRLIGLLSMIFLSVYQALAPTISRRLDRSRPEAFHFVSVIGIILGGLGAAILFVIQSYSKQITLMLYPDAYELTARAFEILAWSLPIIFAGNAFGFYLVNEEKHGAKAYAVISSAGLLINVVGNAILIPRYDLVGAAWMTVVTDAVTTVAMISAAAIIAFAAGDRRQVSARRTEG